MAFAHAPLFREISSHVACLCYHATYCVDGEVEPHCLQAREGKSQAGSLPTVTKLKFTPELQPERLSAMRTTLGMAIKCVKGARFQRHGQTKAE